MQNPKMRNCGDGTMRADNGAYFQYNDYSNKTCTPKTAAYTVLPTDTGFAFDNTGAAGSVTFTLPTPKGGEWFCFVKTASQTVVVATPAGVTINGASSLTSASGATGAGASFLLVRALDATRYIATTQGTWS